MSRSSKPRYENVLQFAFQRERDGYWNKEAVYLCNGLV